MATTPTLDTTRDGKPWVKCRLAVEDRARNDATGEWEKTQTIFHDVVVFGSLAERTAAALRTGDPVIAQSEFRFRAYEDAGGTTRTGTSFVASRSRSLPANGHTSDPASRPATTRGPRVADSTRPRE